MIRNRNEFIGMKWGELTKEEQEELLKGYEVFEDDIEDSEACCIITLSNNLRVVGCYTNGNAIFPYDNSEIFEQDYLFL